MESITTKKIKKSFGVATEQGNITSRYKRDNRLLDNDLNEYVETHRRKEIPKKDGDSFYVVTTSDEQRLDLISYKYYKTPMLWWVIAEASEIYDPFDVPIGTVLRIPDYSAIYGVGGVLL